MVRFLIGLVLVLSIFCLVWYALGQEAFIWALIIGFVGAGLALLLMPRKGPQHAYMNSYRLQALTILVVFCVLFVGSMWLVLHSNLSPNAGGVAIAGMTVVLSGAAVTYGHLMGPPTARKGWLRRRYPAVADAIKRYEKPGDGRELYTPLLVIDGKPYFLVDYIDRRHPSHAIGHVLLDEQGRQVQIEETFRHALKCKMLAVQTIDYGFHERRANEIASFSNAARSMRRVYQILRQQRERFASKGAQALADWEQVMAGEETMLATIDMGLRMSLWQAQWAKDHGMRRLTQVSDKDVEEVEKAMDEMSAPLMGGFGLMAGALEATKRMVKVIEEEKRFPGRRMVMEGLMGIVDAKAGFEKRDQPYQLTIADEGVLQAWRDRMAWADEVDARLAEKAGQEAAK